MKMWKILLPVFFLVGCEAASEPVTQDVIQVYKSPTCGCCNGWVKHLRKHGFKVETTDLKDVSPVKKAQGISRENSSCHTATVGDYFIEGHVPAEDVKRLLTEKPDVKGLTVPGMPIGSPGMEGPNPEAYDVLSVGKDGETKVFNHHKP